MRRRFVSALVFGLAGAALLVGLGVWQVRRLHWKEGLIARIEAKIAADPVAVPAAPDPVRDAYLPVVAGGRLTGQGLRVLTGVKFRGPGHLIVAVLETAGGRRLMVDLGFRPEGGDRSATGGSTGGAGRGGDGRVLAAIPAGQARITGNLIWPDEVDSFTPAPDLSRHLWFARDVPAMARVLGAEPVLIAARRVEGVATRADPMPVSTDGIPNDHRQYALTWFSLALVWLGMTGLLLWRITRRTD
ncbi:SURF1 family protein [Acidimangrovimonas sediminis]|uniref:SURF1 family protein n=1 Tax=Acidimangrovimonas sediminis TaxID=2056283 RepID=UPI000C7FC786|nr:SURF1 family protein [Acidimangrovimonas sediminis]